MTSVVRVIVLVGLITLISGSWVCAQMIRVDEIQQNQTITGHVTGLSPQTYSDYKVIIYIQTDRWYIHPYAGQGGGLSWAAIGPAGRWRIKTVARKYKAQGMAVLLVKRNLPERSTVGNPNQIPSVAKEVLNRHDLEVRGFYGKL